MDPLRACITQTFPLSWETGDKKGFSKCGKNRDLYLDLIFLPGKDPCQQGDYSLGYTEILPDLQYL